MRNFFVYIGLFLMSLYLAALYDSEFLRFLIGFEILLPIILIILVVYLGTGVSIDILGGRETVQKGLKVPAKIKISNSRILPQTSVLVKIAAQSVFSGDMLKCRFQTAVDGKSSVLIACDITTKHVGRMDVSVEKFRVYDYLRVFFIPKKKNSAAFSVLVVPSVYVCTVSVTQACRTFFADSEIYDKTRPGDDSSEIFQLRQYRPGDQLKSIHWKLSARSEDLYVKEASMPVECSVCFFIDFFISERLEQDILDAFMDAVASLSFSMMQEQCFHYLVWYNGVELIRVRIDNENTFFSAMSDILSVSPYREPYNLTGMYEEQYYAQRPKVSFVLDMSLKLTRNDEEIAAFSQAALKEELEGYVLIV